MRKDPKITEQYKKELVDIFIKLSSDRGAVSDFLADILTPAELREIATRWQIIRKLKTGEGQRDIAEDLGIGVATVTRGARTLLNPTGGFSQALRKLDK